MESTQSLLQISAANLAGLCTAYLHSRYYSKAISDARYDRMQAIEDFLITQQIQHIDKQGLDELAVTIRENYYRYF